MFDYSLYDPVEKKLILFLNRIHNHFVKENNILDIDDYDGRLRNNRHIEFLFFLHFGDGLINNR